MQPAILDIALIIGATLRLIRLTTVDDIAAPARLTLIRRSPPRLVDWTHGLLTCPHCIGFWLSAAVVTSWLWAGHRPVWQAATGILTVSYLAGHVSARLDAED